MQLRLFTLVYGAKYIAWLASACLPSLRWPRNYTALRKYACHWDVYCDDADRQPLLELLAPFDIPLSFHPVVHAGGEHLTQHDALVRHTRLCSDHKVAMFVVPPDTVFGEGSLENIFAAGEPPGTCVSFVHVRVDSFLQHGRPWTDPVSNPQLVTLAFQHLHPTWEFADLALPSTNSRIAGVAWRKAGDKLWLVQHRLPTCYLANVNRSDVDWMDRHRPGLWDHGWPEKLVNEQRHRYFGSSDPAFAIELTDMGNNLPSVEPKNADVPDEYAAEFGHHATNRCLVVTLRGE